jgi:hypothetical protein
VQFCAIYYRAVLDVESTINTMIESPIEPIGGQTKVVKTLSLA